MPNNIVNSNANVKTPEKITHFFRRANRKVVIERSDVSLLMWLDL
jgi:hypothetical protein